MTKLIYQRFKGHSISETCRVLGGILSQCTPITTHVDLAVPCSVLAKRVQGGVIRVTNHELEAISTDLMYILWMRQPYLTEVIQTMSTMLERVTQGDTIDSLEQDFADYSLPGR